MLWVSELRSVISYFRFLAALIDWFCHLFLWFLVDSGRRLQQTD